MRKLQLLLLAVVAVFASSCLRIEEVPGSEPEPTDTVIVGGWVDGGDTEIDVP